MGMLEYDAKKRLTAKQVSKPFHRNLQKSFLQSSDDHGPRVPSGELPHNVTWMPMFRCIWVNCWKAGGTYDIGWQSDGSSAVQNER